MEPSFNIFNALISVILVLHCPNLIAGRPKREVLETFDLGACANLSRVRSDELEVSYQEALIDLRERSAGLKIEAEKIKLHLLTENSLHLEQDLTDLLDTVNFVPPLDVTTIVSPTIEALQLHHTVVNEHMYYVRKVVSEGRIGTHYTHKSTRDMLVEYERLVGSFKCSINIALLAAGYTGDTHEEPVVYNQVFLEYKSPYNREVMRTYVLISCDGIDLFSKLIDAYQQM